VTDHGFLWLADWKIIGGIAEVKIPLGWFD